VLLRAYVVGNAAELGIRTESSAVMAVQIRPTSTHPTFILPLPLD